MEKVSGLTKEDFLPIKKRVLFDAFRTKRWDQLSTLYPEEKDLMIQQGTPYRIHFPVSSCIAIALKGHPYLAWTIYRCNTWIINTAQTIKGKLLDKH